MTFVEIFRRKTRLCWVACTRTKTTKVQRSNCERQEAPDEAEEEEGVLANQFLELVGVALASTLPVALLVVAGQTARDVAGPATIISEIMAAAVACLVGVSWFELSSKSWRYFQSGCYEYVYRTGSELGAFLIGWLLVLRHSSCAALASRAISENLDALLADRLSNFTRTKFGRIEQLLGSQLVPLGLLLSVLSTLLSTVAGAAALLRWRRRRSCTLAFNCLLFAVVIFVCVVALYHLDFDNWRTTEKFFPRRAKGVLTGTATVYFAFGISDAAVRCRDSSARSKRRNLIASSLTSNAVSAVTLMSLTSIMTLLVRHSMTSTTTGCPLAEAFGSADVQWMKHFVAAFSTVLLFPSACGQLKRTIDTVAEISSDGLLMKVFRRRGSGSNAPGLWTGVVCGTMASLGALLLNLTTASQLASAATLCVHLIGICHVIADRFRPIDERRKSTKKRRAAASVVDGRRRSEANGVETGTAGHRRRRRRRRRPTTDAGYGTASIDGDGDALLAGDSRASSAAETNGVRRGDALQQQRPEEEEQEEQKPIYEDSWISDDDNDADIPLDDDESSSDTDIDEAVDEYQQQTAQQRCTAANARCSSADDALLLDVQTPTGETHRKSLRLIRVYVVSCSIFAASVCRLPADAEADVVGRTIVVCVVCVSCAVVAVVCCVWLFRMPRNEPGMRLLPCSDRIRLGASLVAVLVVCCLVNSFHGFVSVAMLVWFGLGCVCYLAYGMRHSEAALTPAVMALPEEEQGLIDRPPVI